MGVVGSKAGGGGRKLGGFEGSGVLYRVRKGGDERDIGWD